MCWENIFSCRVGSHWAKSDLVLAFLLLLLQFSFPHVTTGLMSTGEEWEGGGRLYKPYICIWSERRVLIPVRLHHSLSLGNFPNQNQSISDLVNIRENCESSLKTARKIRIKRYRYVCNFQNIKIQIKYGNLFYCSL